MKAGNDVFRVNVDGTGFENFGWDCGVSAGGTGLMGMAIDQVASKMFWMSHPSNNTGSCNLDGSGSTAFGHSFTEAGDVDVDHVAGFVWYADDADGAVYRSNLDGTGFTTLYDSDDVTSLRAWGVAYEPDNGWLYVTDRANDQIIRSNADGTGRTVVISGLGAVLGIAIGP